MYYMSNRRVSDSLGIFKQAGVISDSLKRCWIRPERFLRSIFSDRRFVKEQITDPQDWMYDFFQIAGDMEDIDYLDIDLFQYFTDKELYTLWKCINTYSYMTMGPSLEFGDIVMAEAQPLLENIITTADEVISGEKDINASLRFGHDSNIIPLMALMGIENVAVRKDLDQISNCWNLSEICPMATNLQFIFFRHEDDPSDIKVRIMHNERDAELPVEGAPFYDWQILRNYLMTKLEK